MICVGLVEIIKHLEIAVDEGYVDDGKDMGFDTRVPSRGPAQTYSSRPFIGTNRSSIGNGFAIISC
jgi:hypothetical protein